jgi:hypothetical protein
MADIGSLGSTTQQESLDLGNSTTAGFSIATRRVVWTDPGMYNCEGPFEIFSTPVICLFHGTLKRTGAESVSAAGVSLVLEGFDTQTGKIEWSRPYDDVSTLYANGGAGSVPFVDADHVVVKEGASYRILDLSTGSVVPTEPDQIFWCATIPLVASVLAPTGSGYPNGRAGMDEFFGCNAAGVAVQRHPANHPSIVGVVLNGKFFWPTPRGLEVEPAN